MPDQANVVSLSDKLETSAAAHKAFYAHLERLAAAIAITIDAAARMRSEIAGITPNEISHSFMLAAEQLRLPDQISNCCRGGTRGRAQFPHPMDDIPF